ncbi:MAG: PilZ domain-containing protein [Nevskia sp.]|nr:PilZ domain-containing protein [Nevskia sp.]
MDSRERGQQRRYYRVVYPTTLRPVLLLGDESLPIIDICENGVRFVAGKSAQIEVGTPVEATVKFRSGHDTVIRGTIVRAGAREVAINIERGVTFRLIIAEQRMLLELAKYAVRAGA